MDTKFFKMIDCCNGDDKDPYYFSLYACHKDTPIPTAKEIVERKHIHLGCMGALVVEISMDEFLRLHNELLVDIANSSYNMAEWSPNIGGFELWTWWETEDKYNERIGVDKTPKP